MLTTDSIAIKKSLVHKKREENVLINNLRMEIPPFLKADFFRNDLLPQLKSADREIVKEAYILREPVRDSAILSEYTDSFYCFRQIIPVLTQTYMEQKKINLSDETLGLLSRYYHKSAQGQMILKAPVRELEQMEILKLLGENSLLLKDSEKSYISDLLFEAGLVEPECGYYSNMVVDLNHEFYFEHYNEHVPGMMVIEALRQFGLASCHKYGNIPSSEYQIMMSDLEIHFEKYVDYHFPIKLAGSIDVKKTNSSGMWKKVNLDFSVYQNSVEAVNIKFNGRSIEKALFGELRQEELYNMIEKFRFQPHTNHNHKHKFCLRNRNSREYIHGELKEISTSGFQMKIENGDKYVRGELHDFFFSFENLYFIHGSCKQERIRNENDKLIIDFAFSELTREDYDNLVICIKQYTKAIEDKTLIK